MKTLLGIPVMAVLMTVIAANTTQAACCGAVSYKHVGCTDPVSYGCAKQQCHTVMKTCREVVYEKQSYTCYKNCYNTTYEDKVIDCVKNVRETHYRECSYTVCKPVYETHYRTCNYTVCKPVWES